MGEICYSVIDMIEGLKGQTFKCHSTLQLPEILNTFQFSSHSDQNDQSKNDPSKIYENENCWLSRFDELIFHGILSLNTYDAMTHVSITGKK